MKTIFTLAVLSCFFNLYSQKTVVSVSNTQVAYVGIDNRIAIAVEGYKLEELVVKTTEPYTIVKSGESFLLNVSGRKEKIPIYVGIKNGNNVHWLDTLHIWKAYLPAPEPKWGDLSPGDYVKDSLVVRNKIKADIGVDIEGIDWKVISCFAVLARKNQEMRKFILTSDTITDELKEEIMHSGDGSVLCVTDIKVSGPGGVIKMLPAMVFTIHNCPCLFPGWCFTKELMADACYRHNNTYSHEMHIRPVCENWVYKSDTGKDYIRDSVWKYWYKNMESDYVLYQKDIYKDGKLLASEYFDSLNQNTPQYTHSYLNDSMQYYTAYYPNGSLKCAGYTWNKNYLNSSCRVMIYRGLEDYYDNVPYSTLSVFDEMDILPLGNWIVYNIKGYAIAEFSVNIKDDYLKDYIRQSNHCKESIDYSIVLDGPCTIYNGKGKVQEVLYFDKGVLRK